MAGLADTLNGGAGNDTYVFGYGDGVDRIYDYDNGANIDTVSFKAGAGAGFLGLEGLLWREAANDSMPLAA